MSRKFKYLLLMLGLVLLVLPLGGCTSRNTVSETNVVSGIVTLVGEQKLGLVDVTILVIDEAGSYVATDHVGAFEIPASAEAIVIPRKTGYRFVPEEQVIGEKQKLEFVAYPWAEPDFANWGAQFSFAAHSELVEAVAFSLDDQYLASGSDDRTVRIWNVSDGQLVRTMTGHTSAIKAIDFSPQGQYLASGSKDGKIIIWDWRAGQAFKTLAGHTDQVTDLKWSPDGTMLASSSWDRQIRVWDLATGKELVSFVNQSWVRTVAWSLDGSFLYSGGDDLSLKIWDVSLGSLSRMFEVEDKIMSLSVAPKDPLVAIALKNGAAKVLNLETSEETTLGGHKGEVTILRWSADGRHLAGVGSDRRIWIWDWEEQELVNSINTGNYVFSLAWGNESAFLASGGYQGIIDIWSTESEENLLKIAGHTSAIKALAWSPQGDYLASGGEDRLIRLWDLQNRKELALLTPGHSSTVEDLAWSQDGAYLASCGHDFLVRVWNISEGEYLGALTERIKKPFVHERGFEFAVGMHSVSHEDIVLSVSWAPNGTKLSSASWDKTVAIWDLATKTQVAGIQNPQGWITTVAWSPQSDLLAFGGYDQNIHVYNGLTGKELKKLVGHTGWVQSLTWSPDGKYLASSSYDQKIFIWDLETNQIVETLTGDENIVTVVEWSPCGRYLAGGSHSGTVRIWDLASGEVLYTYLGQRWGLESLAWSPQGDQLAITEYNAIIILGPK